MGRSFMFLLLTQASAGAVLTVMLLAVRWFTKRKVRPCIFHASWLLIALRMLIPISLPNPLLMSGKANRILLPEKLLFSVQAYDATSAGNTVLPAQPSLASIPVSMMTAETMLLLVWFFGAVFCTAFMLWANRSLIKRAHLKPLNQGSSAYPLYLSNLPSPCVLGVIRPRIALTKESLQPENYRYALLHETLHIKRHDLWWALLGNITLALFWFSPFAWLAASASRRDCELALDEAAAKQMSREERLDYAHVLLRLSSNAGQRLSIGVLPISGTKKNLKERLEFITDFSARKKAAGIITIALLVIFSVASFATAQGIVTPVPHAYVQNELKNRLLELEKTYPSGLGKAAVYGMHITHYDGETNEYWEPFIEALFSVDSAEDYNAFINSRFPGINEAYPGYTPVAQLGAMVDMMLRSEYQIEPGSLPYRYESSWGPGRFEISGGDDRYTHYNVEIQQDEITGVSIYDNPETKGQSNLSQPVSDDDERIQRAVALIEAFAKKYLAGRDRNISIGFDRVEKPLPSGRIPAKYIVFFEKTDTCYDMVVDLHTMKVVEARLRETPINEVKENEYAIDAWNMDDFSYADLVSNNKLRVNAKQVYLCTGILTDILSNDPQTAIMNVGTNDKPLYVTLKNASGLVWEKDSPYRIYAHATGMQKDMPVLTSLYSYK